MLPRSYIPVLRKYTSTEVLKTLEEEGDKYESSKIVFIGTCGKDVMNELDKFRNFPGCLQKFGPDVRSYQLPPTIFKCPVGGKKMRKFIYKQDAFNCLMGQLPLDGLNRRTSKIIGSVCEAYLRFKEEKLLDGRCELVVYNINDFEHLNYEFRKALEENKRMVIPDHTVQGFNFNDTILEKLESVIGELGHGHSVDSILDNREIAKLKTSEKMLIIRHVETLIDEMELFIKRETNYFLRDEDIKMPNQSLNSICPIRVWRKGEGNALCFPEKVYKTLMELHQDDMKDELEEMSSRKPTASINYRRLSPFFMKHMDEFWDLPLQETEGWTDPRVFFFDMNRFVKEHPRYFPQYKNPKALQVRMFNDDDQEPFCLAREVLRALLQLNCKDEQVLDMLEELEVADPLATVYYEDFEKQKLFSVDLKDLINKEPPVLLIKTPILRTKNRAIFIPSYDGKYCILVADAFIEILRWLISERNFFEMTKYKQNSWNKFANFLYLTLKTVDEKFVTNMNAPSFIDVTKLEQAKEMLREMLPGEFEEMTLYDFFIKKIVKKALVYEEDIQEVLNESIECNNNEEMLDKEPPVNNEEASNDTEVSNDEVTLSDEQAPNGKKGSNSKVESNVDDSSDDRKTPVNTTSELKTIIMQGLEWLPNLPAHLQRVLDIDNKKWKDEKRVGEMYEGVEYCLLLAVLEHLPQFSSWLVKEKAWPRKQKESSSRTVTINNYL